MPKKKLKVGSIDYELHLSDQAGDNKVKLLRDKALSCAKIKIINFTNQL